VKATTKEIDAALMATFQAVPKNSDVGAVGVKTAALNGLYSTSIFGVIQVARHIVSWASTPHWPSPA
jgi:hypothetical protein